MYRKRSDDEERKNNFVIYLYSQNNLIDSQSKIPTVLIILELFFAQERKSVYDFISCKKLRSFKISCIRG